MAAHRGDSVNPAAHRGDSVNPTNELRIMVAYLRARFGISDRV